MPLQLRISNALQDLINHRVEVHGTFLEGNVFEAATIRALDGDAGDPTLGTVAVGASEWINGVRITFHEMVQDSRCPIDTYCIEGGAVVANVTLESDTDRVTRNFPSDEVPYAFDIFKIYINHVSPPLISDEVIEPDEYEITFKVERNRD